jgi:hypothetical protein
MLKNDWEGFKEYYRKVTFAAVLKTLSITCALAVDFNR